MFVCLVLACLYIPLFVSSDPTCLFPLDILFVQDATTGFADDLTYHKEHQTISTLIDFIQTSHPSSRLGLLSFRDKPLWPAGGSSDYCTHLDFDLSDDMSAFESTWLSLSSAGGGDWAEGQFSAMVEGLKSNAISWRRDTLRLMIMITDAPIHFAGDGIGKIWNLPAFETYDSNVDLCTKRDYPSMGQVKLIADSSEINIAFIVSDETQEQLSWRAWTWVNDQLNGEMKIDVQRLASDGSNLTSAFEAIIRRVEESQCSEEDVTDDDCTLEPLPESYEERLENAVNCLNKRAIKFVGRNDPEYAAATTPQDTYFKKPNTLAIIYPTNTTTVQGAVECAFENRVNIIARSGGHDYSSYSYGVDNDIILDLKYMEDFKINRETGVATVGPGLRLSPLIYNAFLNGKWMVPGGACTAVGLGGHATGGGYGYYSRALGLLSDCIIGGQIVLGNGTLIDFDEDKNSDLLWALQGGTAANFGVLTELTLQMIQAPPRATALTIAYPATSLQGVLEGMTVMLEKAPRSLGFSAVWDNTKTAIQMNYFGTYAETQNILAPFFERAGQGVILGNEGDFLHSFASLAILSITDTERPAVPIPASLLPGLNTTAATYVAPRESYQAKSMLWGSTAPFNDECIATIVKAVQGAPSNFGLAVELWGGDSAIAQREDGTSAFPHRNATFVSHIYAKNQLIISPADVAFLEKYYKQVIQCASKAVYVNYKDFQLGQDQLDTLTWTTTGDAERANEMYFTTSLDRLKEVKAKYNPWKSFWFPQSI